MPEQTGDEKLQDEPSATRPVRTNKITSCDLPAAGRHLTHPTETDRKVGPDIAKEYHYQ